MERTGTLSYLSPKTTGRHLPAKGGWGFFATGDIHPNELLILFGGDVVNGEMLHQMTELEQRYSIQIEDDLYMVSRPPFGPADYINHSCDPNAGIHGQIAIVAMRPIAAGEEICIDYAMCDSSPYDEFDCACGKPTCRKKVTGNDWQRADLQARYAGYFSAYLQRKISAS